MTTLDFAIVPSAQVYKIVRSISGNKIREVFRACSENKIGRYVFEEVRLPTAPITGSPIYSIVIFKIENEPSFLNNTHLVETKYAFLLVIECANYLFVFKKHIESPEREFGLRISPLKYSDFSSFKANDETEYERVVMNNMTISDAVIKNRSFEGRNLNGLLPSNSASRSIASTFRLNSDGEVYSVVPNTSRLTLRSPKLGIASLGEWCMAVVRDLDVKGASNSFINNFASPVNLNLVKSVTQASAIFIDLEDLDLRLREGDGDWKLLQKTDEGPIVLTDAQVKLIFDAFRSPIKLVKNELKEDSFSLNIKGASNLMEIRLGKNLVTVRSRVGDNILIGNELGGEISLTKYLNMNKSFSVVFENPSYIYFSRNAFEDKKLLKNIEGMMSIFIGDYDFLHVTSEKAKPHRSDATDFPDQSLFDAVEKHLGGGGKVVICDDMDDEWADHIIIAPEEDPPTISFVHSKFSKIDSYGASKLHEVVSQALKNLGRLNSDVNDYRVKYDSKWSGSYEATNIDRVRSGHNWNEIEVALKKINGNPNTIRKVILATPFFGKENLREKLEALAEGNDSEPAYTQVVWLVNTFISSCRDYNLHPYILCKA